MTLFQIEVRAVAETYDTQARQLARDILQLPPKLLPLLTTLATDPNQPPLTIHTSHLYHIAGNLDPSEIDRLMRELLADPVVQEATVFDSPDNRYLHIVDIFYHPGVTDTLAESVIGGAQMLGMSGIERVETGRRYHLDARFSESEARIIAETLLYNPVIQQYTLHPAQNLGGKMDVNKLPHPGPVGSRLIVEPDVSRPTPIDRPPGQSTPSEDLFVKAHNRAPTERIPISDMTNEQLLDLSKRGLLALNLEEMRAIQQYYRAQGREPTDVELETLAQTWSEHCSHKTFKATIAYSELDSQGNVLEEETIAGLLKQYLMAATHTVKSPWLVSAFSDNAGIIRFTDTHDIAFKVETHNHPSAIEPFGGANTGVGGVIRDILGVSAQPIACTDVLCFGPPGTSLETLPPGVLTPRRITSGVVNGVRDYGNKMGIPTVNGAVLYHDGYIYNPLVFCGCLGLLPHGSHPRNVQPGDRIVVLGGRTGRDGIHGATFSSGEMSSEINTQAGSAVQIGAPITEKKVADIIIQARDRQLYHAITDCGAGGFSSAIGEMGAEIGAHVELEKAPLKYQGLAPWEIWLSEAQERMVLAVPPEHLDELLEICEIEEVEASIIGTFTSTHRLVVTYHGETVAGIDMAFLHGGRPGRTLEAVWTRPPVGPQFIAPGNHIDNADPTVGARLIAPGNDDDVGADLSCPSPIDRPPGASSLSGNAVTVHQYAPTLLSLLRHPTIASKEEIIRRYDHEVQGATVLKPLVGRTASGPGDAAVLQPILDTPARAGIVIANGINPLYGTIDPYHMAINAVDEALRNLTAVGGNIEQAAILDNFCWGNPNDPEQLGMLVRAVKGCRDAAIGFGVPFISGKDSLNNEYRDGERRLPVIPTLLISAVGVIDDAAQTVDMSLKSPGNLLYLVGTTREEMAGSHYAEVVGSEMFEQLFPYAVVPRVDISHAYDIMRAVGAAIRKGLVQSCHDLSEGGLAVALAEMAIASSLGVRIDLGDLPPQDIHHNVGNIVRLFSESPSRFIVEVERERWETFEQHMRSNGVHDVKHIGIVTGSGYLHIFDRDELIYLPVSQLQQAWKGEQA